jgi:trigger factor
MAQSQLGENVPDDEIKEKSSVRGDFVQLNDSGEEIEEGIRPNDVLIAIDLIKDDEIKNNFVGQKSGDVVIFDPVKAFENRHEVRHMLKIKQDEADVLNSNFKFTINEILRFEKAELNEDIFKKLYGEETDVKTVEDFTNRIKLEIEANLIHSSNHKFALDAHDKLVEQANITLPEAFLKRWLVAINKEITIEHNQKTYVLSSRFTPEGPKYSFVVSGEELNPGLTVTVYRELVKEHFNYTQDVHLLEVYATDYTVQVLL